jgi:hypothetical protein
MIRILKQPQAKEKSDNSSQEPVFVGTISIDSYRKALADPKVQATLARARAKLKTSDKSAELAR